MDDRITIIEGPPPVFEAVRDGWAMGLNEGPRLSIPLLTRLRTFNGPALVERCHRAWRNKTDIRLYYRNEMGIEQSAPIAAARSISTPEGDVLLLWVYFDSDHIEFEFDAGEDDSAEDERD